LEEKVALSLATYAIKKTRQKKASHPLRLRKKKIVLKG